MATTPQLQNILLSRQSPTNQGSYTQLGTSNWAGNKNMHATETVWASELADASHGNIEEASEAPRQPVRSKIYSQANVSLLAQEVAEAYTKYINIYTKCILKKLW